MGDGPDVLARLIVTAGQSVSANPVLPDANERLTAAGLPASPLLEAPPPIAASYGQLGRYRLVGELGRGASGRVFEAYDPELRRKVAIKVLAAPEQELVERFVAEAHVTAQLEHPGIIPIHDFGMTPDGQIFIVMKRVHGRTLFKILGAIARGEEPERSEWTPHRRLSAFVQICRAVGYAHDRGVVHRDLKPSNVMFGAFGEALVLDWGIARVLKNSAEPVDRYVSHHTHLGQAMGTVGYMSPEQILGAHKSLGPPSDVWSLGVILFELLTLRRALKGSLHEVSARVTQGPLSVEGIPEEIVPAALGRIITRATAVSIADRYPNAAALVEVVDAAMRGESSN
jgi:serine/threonine protein kinase